MTNPLFARMTSCDYTDRDVKLLLLDIASRPDIAADELAFDPTDAFTIDSGGNRAAVWPSDDGTELVWELMILPRRGGWRVIGSGSGNESDMRIAVLPHLRGEDALQESAAS
ncbi:hypothetical protein [Mycobacteroides abscessus]|uniref:hypothetical protein n=1 Tax=Mycobacteroides abscessus TaxID=36809 RepID=UPI0014735A59